MLAASSIIVLAITGEREPQPQAPTKDRPSIGEVVVPELRGLSAFEARRRLALRNLTLDEILPARGQPGLVIGSEPGVGQLVAAESPVTLFIGVQPDRLRQEDTHP